MRRFASLVCALSAFGMASCALSEDSRPSRSDCLVRVDFPDGFRDDHQVDGLAIASELGIPLAGYGARGEVLFLQFDDGCDQRRAFTATWMKEYMSRSAWPAEWVVSEDRIEPGRATIDIRGSAWRDG